MQPYYNVLFYRFNVVSDRTSIVTQSNKVENDKCTLPVGTALFCEWAEEVTVNVFIIVHYVRDNRIIIIPSAYRERKMLVLASAKRSLIMSMCTTPVRVKDE